MAIEDEGRKEGGRSVFGFEDGDEGFLGDGDFSELLHALFAFLLLFEEFALAGDVAAVALGGDVLAEGADGGARDDLRAQGGLDGDGELLGGILRLCVGEILLGLEGMREWRKA